MKTFSSDDGLRSKRVENNKNKQINKQHKTNMPICLVIFVHVFDHGNKTRGKKTSSHTVPRKEHPTKLFKTAISQQTLQTEHMRKQNNKQRNSTKKKKKKNYKLYIYIYI